MKLKIISDGTGIGTHVVNAETGEKLEYVMEAVWKVDSPGFATVYLTMVDVQMDVEGEAEIEKIPLH